jgi:3-oxoacyl-[acyl-carrier protein] reductase
MQVDLSGKTCLVTGGASGIGRATALMLARAGATVALTYYRHDGTATSADIAAVGQTSYAFPLDATDTKQVNQVIAQAAARLDGRINLLVNNAGGLIARQPIATMTDAHWHQVLDTNLYSAFRCIRAALDYMPDGGRIINISSLAAHTGGGPGSVAYAVAKSGMNGLTRALAKELGPRRITVNAVAPGLILNTPFHATFTPQQDQNATIRATPLQRAGNPDDVAAAVLYLASDASSFCTGTILDVNGGTNFR